MHLLTGNQKMETTVDLELEALQDKSSRHDLLEWLNNLLLTKFTKLEQICSGMCFALQ